MKVPDTIRDANVMAFAVVNLAIYTGNTQHSANGMLLGPAYGLIICKCEPDK